MLRHWLHRMRGHATTRIPVTVFTPTYGPAERTVGPSPHSSVLVAELHLGAAISRPEPAGVRVAATLLRRAARRGAATGSSQRRRHRYPRSP